MLGCVEITTFLSLHSKRVIEPSGSGNIAGLKSDLLTSSTVPGAEPILDQDISNLRDHSQQPSYHTRPEHDAALTCSQALPD